MGFSVLISTYKTEKAEYFQQAIESILNQTRKADQIVLVRDGPVGSELQNTIDFYLKKYSDLFTYVPLEENGGLGNALKKGLEYCKHELVARMDTDDICLPNRFELQIRAFELDSDLDIVGGNIAEFVSLKEEIVSRRIVPETHIQIMKRIKSRSPFNHMTVMFKKSSVIKAGSYQAFYLFEDWYLWIRMALNNCKFFNIQETLVYARITDMSERRGGKKYYKSCKNLLKFMYNNHMISWFSYKSSCFIRFSVSVLCPNKLRAWVYKNILRK